MTVYRIFNRTSGSCLGDYEGCDAFDAIDLMTRRAGYQSIEDAAHTLGMSTREYKDDLVCEAVEEES